MSVYDDFFNPDKPCPSEIKNCLELRNEYLSYKKNLFNSSCTNCNLIELQLFFYKKIFKLNKNKINVIKKISKNTISLKQLHDTNCKEIKKFKFKNSIIDEDVFLCDKNIIIYNSKTNFLFKVNILFKLKIFNHLFFLCTNRRLMQYFIFTFFIINTKINKLLYYKNAKFRK